MKIKIHQCKYIEKGFPFNSLALAIMKLSDTDYSHYAISFETSEGTKYAQAIFPVSNVVKEKDFLKRYKIVGTLEIDLGVSESEFFTWLLPRIGIFYPLSQLVGLALRMFKIVKKNPFGRGAKLMICNELVILIFTRFKGFVGRDSDDYDLVETAQIVKHYSVGGGKWSL